MTEVHRKLITMAEGYLITLDALIEQAKELQQISEEMNAYLDSYEYMTAEQPEEELDAQIELGKLMGLQFIELYDILEQLK